VGALVMACSGVASEQGVTAGKLFLKADGSLNTLLFADPALLTSHPAVHPTPAGQRLMAQAVVNALYDETASLASPKEKP
jgi:phospholipase/lecithinase/hemolysin